MHLSCINVVNETMNMIKEIIARQKAMPHLTINDNYKLKQFLKNVKSLDKRLSMVINININQY